MSGLQRAGKNHESISTLRIFDFLRCPRKRHKKVRKELPTDGRTDGLDEGRGRMNESFPSKTSQLACDPKN